ncbi:unnamed protein product, partial [Urochloa humidicola]
MGWSFEVAKKFGIRIVSFWPAATATLAIIFKIPKLIEDGLIDDKGWAERDETFQLAPGMPTFPTSQMPWMDGMGTPVGAMFELISGFIKLSSLAEVVFCNSFDEAEAGAFKLFHDFLPIGPLFADREYKKPVG